MEQRANISIPLKSCIPLRLHYRGKNATKINKNNAKSIGQNLIFFHQMILYCTNSVLKVKETDYHSMQSQFGPITWPLN